MPENQTREQALSAALAELEKKPETPPAPVEQVKPPEPPKEPEAPKPAETQAKTEEKKDSVEVPTNIKAAFDKLAQEKSAFRKEMDEAKPYLAGLKALSPVEVAALAKAKASGDPLAVLSAFGFSYTDVANRMVNLSTQKPKETEAKHEIAPEIEELRKELSELKAFRAQQEQERMLSQISAQVKGRRHIEALGEHKMVLGYLLDHIQRTGSPPGSTFEESVAIAADAVEQDLAAQAKRFAALSNPLTNDPPPVMKSEGTSVAPTGQGSSGKTVTNEMAQSRTEPTKKSREDILQGLLADPNFR